VSTAARTGNLPLPVLDALVGDPDGDSDYRVYVGAGPLEDLLRNHPHSYAEAIAERAATSAAWTEALTGVWLHHAEWTALPERLRRRVPQPQDAGRRPRKKSWHERRGVAVNDQHLSDIGP
jgi:hypothetical protein